MTQVPDAPPPNDQPVAYEYVVQPKPPIWHKVIGIISIVFASLGIVCTPISMGMNAMNPAQKEAMEMFPDWWQSYQLFSCFLGVAFSILLLVAGICLLRRRQTGRSLHLVYAGIALVMCIVGTLVTVSLMNTDDMPPEIRVGMMIGVVFGILFGSAYPIFLLIWFMRAKIRNEAASWAQTQTQDPMTSSPYMQ